MKVKNRTQQQKLEAEASISRESARVRNPVEADMPLHSRFLLVQFEMRAGELTAVASF